MISKTHCVNGHEFTPGNTRRSKRQRHCRTCERSAGARYRASHLSKEKSRTREAARKAKRELVEYKGGSCVDCGGLFPACCYHFDHKDPQEKAFGIALKIHRPIEELKIEADKCDLVCANCHAIRTFGNPEVGKKITASRLAAKGGV